MKSKTYLYIGTAALLLSFFMIGNHFYQKSQKTAFDIVAKENADAFIRDYSPVYGDKDAKILVTEFLDPECESCRAAYPQVKNLLAEYKGKVQLTVRYAAFHKNSHHAIAVLEATRKQGKFWRALELLFYHQPEWASHHNPQPQKVFEILPQLGFDMDKLRKDMKDSAIPRVIEQDAKDLKTLNVRGTPTFFVNGQPLEGYGIDFLRKKIHEEAQRLYP